MLNLWGASSTGPTFHPPTVHLAEGAPLFGLLTPQDLEWTCAGGFVTETQTWYATLPDGRVMMTQIIHSAVGLWYPNIQFTFGLYDTSKPSKPERVWKSVNVSNFVTPPPPSSNGPKLDKRSSKSDQFTMTVDPAKPDTYVIRGKYDDEVDVSLEFTRMPNVPGWKLGSGPRGGMTYFGALKPAKADATPAPDTAAGGDGYVIHRFWPRCTVGGIARVKGQVIDLKADETRGVFIHAIQGMRPNLIAARWMFADFQSSAADGVSLVQMQFTTPSSYGTKSVTVGSVVVDDKLVSVSVGTDDVKPTAAKHTEEVRDAETSYKAPHRILFTWSGPSIEEPSATPVTATIDVDLKPATPSSTFSTQSRGLVERVDVMAEIPFVIKKVVNAVSGAKPYIYQWSNPVEAKISLPAKGDTPAKSLTVKGQLYNESSYVSEP